MSKTYNSLLLTSLLILLMTATGCRKQSSDISAIMASDSLPATVKNVVKAVADNDSASFALLVSYPLQRPYPLHDIDNAQQMRDYYSTIVDATLRKAIIASNPEKWSKFGWRGWSLDNGKYLWVDESLYDIPYLSRRETALRDSLMAAEINSIPEAMRKGYTPVGCLLASDDKTVYRIDAATDPDVKANRSYRLSVYPQGKNLKIQPRQVYYGEKIVEGTAATTSYVFHVPHGASIIYNEDISDGSAPQLIHVHPDGSETLQPVVPSYWLDIIN